MIKAEPSAPLLHARKNDERWQFEMKGGASMAHELPTWRLGGHRARHSELLALFHLDCACLASTLLGQQRHRRAGVEQAAYEGRRERGCVDASTTV